MYVQEEIAAVAYELYEGRCRTSGCDFDDWLDAERIVLGRHAGQDFEEPEEEDESETIATGVRSETKVPLKKPEGESEEIYVNEEMS